MSKPPWPARPARPASTAYIIFKTLAQTAAFWFVFLAVLPWCIRQFESLAQLPEFRGVIPTYVCIALFAFGGTLGLWSAWSMARVGRGTPFPFDCPPRLVVRGPYAYVRNPMAIGGLTQGLAVGLYLGSSMTMAYVIAGAILWNQVIRVWEEHDLAERFGADFETYRSRVRCWIPRTTRYAGLPSQAMPDDGSSSETRG